MLVKRSIRKRVIGKQITQTNYQKKKKKKLSQHLWIVLRAQILLKTLLFPHYNKNVRFSLYIIDLYYNYAWYIISLLGNISKLQRI